MCVATNGLRTVLLRFLAVILPVLVIAGCSVAANPEPSAASAMASPNATPTMAASPSPSPAPSAGWHWTDPDVHAVDGYYVTTERPCPQDSSDHVCAAAIKTAVTEEPGLKLFTAAVAATPGRWVDGDGVAYHSLGFGGLMGPTFLLLTLPSGERRTVPLLCQGDMFSGGGAVGLPGTQPGDVTTGAGGSPELVSSAFCQSWDAGQYHVGALLPSYGIKDLAPPTSGY